MLAVVLLTACGGNAPDLSPVSTPVLRQYQTPIPSATLSAGGAVETPLPTATPMTYTVVYGDTLYGIAGRFGLSLEELTAANPGILATALQVGTVLSIPAPSANISGEPTPTPVPLIPGAAGCYPTVDGGLWCLLLVTNDYADALENVTAQVILLDAAGAPLDASIALLPLDVLPAGAALPLAVFFPPQAPAAAFPQVQVLTATRLLPGDARYLPASVRNPLVEVERGGLSARVSGRIVLDGAIPARQIWLAAVAFDAGGRPVGVLRWEAPAGLTADATLPFTLVVASLGPPIARVDLVVEARP